MPAEHKDETQSYIDRIAELELTCAAWERWYEGIVSDFVGLTTDRNDPDRLHDWGWIDQWRAPPPPTRIEVAVDQLAEIL